MSGLVQLEELVLRCRDQQVRRYVEEAVACYNAGAYRAAIVTTWIAVVFDILGKLRELELTGDAAARAELEKFSRHQATRDIDGVLRFERDILALAKNQFELLSPLEYDDLRRLQEDRNRCAHPSMYSDDEIYSPSAELARLHLRAAVEHLVSRPPVQGRAALTRILADVTSGYFPPLSEDAIVFLRDGPLSRPRDSLVRNLVMVLLKDALEDASNEGYNVATRRLNALVAVRSLHTGLVDAALNDNLSRLLEQLPDEKLALGVLVVGRLSGTWEYLTDAIRLTLQRYVRDMPEDYVMPILGLAANCKELQPFVEHRLRTLPSEYLTMVARVCERQAPDLLVRTAIERLKRSRSYRESMDYARLVMDYAQFVTPDQAYEIGEIICNNGQVGESYAASNMITSLSIQNGLRNSLEKALDAHNRLGDFQSAIDDANDEDWTPF